MVIGRISRMLLLAWILFNLLDLLTTLIVFHAGGMEINPLPAHVFASQGIWGGTLLKLAVTALIPLLVSGLSRRFKHISVALSISTVMMAVIVAWNMLNIVLG